MVPVEYVPDFLGSAMGDRIFAELMMIDWVQVPDVPRKEYYVNMTDVPYTYGSGRGVRTYETQEWTPEITICRQLLGMRYGVNYDVCFLNRYDTNRDALGWHSDDSPEMDPARPIVTMTLGASREIQFRNIEDPTLRGSIILQHRSIAIMPPGFQQTWQHRIPKAGHVTGSRISLTFRGYLPQ